MDKGIYSQEDYKNFVSALNSQKQVEARTNYAMLTNERIISREEAKDTEIKD